MTRPQLAHVGIAVLVLGTSALEAQQRVDGPTVVAARAAVFVPAAPLDTPIALGVASTPCGSHLKNAALLGLGFSLAASVLELIYTVVREPLVRRGHDVPAADPVLIAWAGGAGFAIGLIGTEICRRRQR